MNYERVQILIRKPKTVLLKEWCEAALPNNSKWPHHVESRETAMPKILWRRANCWAKPCEAMREHREGLGITLAEIRRHTNINTRFLQAIERGEIDKLPGGLYSISFVKAYAEYIGADEATIKRLKTLVEPGDQSFSMTSLVADRSLIISERPPQPPKFAEYIL